MSGDVLFIKRCFTGDAAGTWGVFSFDNHVPLCCSLELPWRDNLPRESCILPDDYGIQVVAHAKFGRCVRLEDKHGRAGVLIHAGNTTMETQGCILPGLGWGSVIGRRAVVQSKAALSLVCDTIEHQRLKILRILGIGDTA